MRPEDVDAALVEKVEASLREDGAYSDDVAREWVARHALAAVLPLYGAIVADEILDLGDADYEAAKADPATGVRSYREGFLDGHDRAGRVVEKYRTARLTTTTEEPTT